MAVPSLDAVPRLAPESAPSAERLVLDRTAVQILLRVDGLRNVRVIVGDRPIVATLRELALLAEQGLIVLDPVVPAAAPPDNSSAAAGAKVELAAPRAAGDAEDSILGVCPKLGFADDAARHYSRPTALHRCYATQPSSVISSQEQRDLCFGGRYPTCPRFRVATVDEPGSAPSIPPGVATRLALARTMLAAPTTTEQVPDWIGRDPTPAPPPPTPAPRTAGRARLGRGPLLIAGGAGVGLLLVLGALVALPRIRPGLVQTPPTSAPAFVSVATQAAPRTSVPLAAATVPVKPSAVPTTPPRPPTPTVAQLAASVLLDARFAGGAQKEWLENEPFAGWRDGAYRLNARQATRFVAIAAPVRVPDDVTISATMRKTGGPPGGGYGIIVRNQSAEALNGTNQTFDAYVAEAGDLGEFGVWRREGDRWVDLVPWTRSQAVRQGGSPNELIVRLAGGQILLTINGIEVGRVDDDVLAHGGVGVFAGGDNNEVALDRFTVRVPN